MQQFTPDKRPPDAALGLWDPVDPGNLFQYFIEKLLQLSHICTSGVLNSFDAKCLQDSLLHLLVVYLSCPLCVKTVRV